MRMIINLSPILFDRLMWHFLKLPLPFWGLGTFVSLMSRFGKGGHHGLISIVTVVVLAATPCLWGLKFPLFKVLELPSFLE